MGDVAGWPMLRPVGRGLTWLLRFSIAFIAAGGVLQAADAVISTEGRPGWQWALIAVGGVVALTGSVCLWVLAGRAHRLVPDPARPRAAAAEYRAARRALRAGAVLTDTQRLRVAVEVAQLELTGGLAVLLAAQLGSQVLSWSAQASSLSSTTSGIVLVAGAVQLMVVGALTVVLWRGRRLRVAAERIGAVAHRPAR